MSEAGRAGGDAPWALDLRGTGPSALARVRGWAAGTLGHLGPDHVADVLMVVDELVSNAYEHTTGPTFVRLTVLARPCLVVVEADDPARVRPRVRHPEITDLRGRGMQLVDSLADDWGVHENTEGKTVWARLSCGTAARGPCQP